jgi:hypothetical protein
LFQMLMRLLPLSKANVAFTNIAKTFRFHLFISVSSQFCGAT